jgi:hypothetical protein
LSGGLDLRILGFGSQVPLSPFKRLFPAMWTAFAVTAVSGTALLIADATTKLASPVFYVKMVFVALALIILQLIKTQVFSGTSAGERAPSGNVKLLALASLFLWIAATTTGRLMAYIGPVSGLE